MVLEEPPAVRPHQRAVPIALDADPVLAEHELKQGHQNALVDLGVRALALRLLIIVVGHYGTQDILHRRHLLLVIQRGLLLAGPGVLLVLAVGFIRLCPLPFCPSFPAAAAAAAALATAGARQRWAGASPSSFLASASLRATSNSGPQSAAASSPARTRLPVGAVAARRPPSAASGSSALSPGSFVPSSGGGWGCSIVGGLLLRHRRSAVASSAARVASASRRPRYGLGLDTDLGSGGINLAHHFGHSPPHGRTKDLS